MKDVSHVMFVLPYQFKKVAFSVEGRLCRKVSHIGVNPVVWIRGLHRPIFSVRARPEVKKKILVQAWPGPKKKLKLRPGPGPARRRN